MAIFKSVPVASQMARELAELNGIRSDLEHVRILCDKIQAATADLLDFDSVVTESLCVHAIIRYARCFASGVRPNIYASVAAAFSPEQHKLHDYLIHYRSKFVAHSVNPYEQNEVTVGFLRSRLMIGSP